MQKPKTEISAETVQKILQDHKPISLTQIAHALGFKGSVSGSLSKRLRELVPNISDLLSANKPATHAKDAHAEKTPKTVKKPTAVKESVPKKPSKAGFPIPEICPYRPSSAYAKAWAILYAHREKGISKADLIEKYKSWTLKPMPNCEFDVHVVTSPKEDGSAHRSASRASGV
jgi:hypothetical protein